MLQVEPHLSLQHGHCPQITGPEVTRRDGRAHRQRSLFAIKAAETPLWKRDSARAQGSAAMAYKKEDGSR